MASTSYCSSPSIRSGGGLEKLGPWRSFMCPTSYRWIQVDSSGFQVQFPFMEYSSWIPCHSFWTFFQWIPVDSSGFKWIQVDSSGLWKKISNLYLILY